MNEVPFIRTQAGTLSRQKKDKNTNIIDGYVLCPVGEINKNLTGNETFFFGLYYILFSLTLKVIHTCGTKAGVLRYRRKYLWG